MATVQINQPGAGGRGFIGKQRVRRQRAGCGAERMRRHPFDAAPSAWPPKAEGSLPLLHLDEHEVRSLAAGLEADVRRLAASHQLRCVALLQLRLCRRAGQRGKGASSEALCSGPCTRLSANSSLTTPSLASTKGETKYGSLPCNCCLPSPWRLHSGSKHACQSRLAQTTLWSRCSPKSSGKPWCAAGTHRPRQWPPRASPLRTPGRPGGPRPE